MNILYVSGSCLTKNTSANMSHNAFVNGLIDNGCNVDIIMADDSWGEQDNMLSLRKEATYYTFPSVSFSDRLRRKIKGPTQFSVMTAESKAVGGERSLLKRAKALIRSIGKKAFYLVFRPDPLYPLEKKWLKSASSFQSNKTYDIVISNSSPAASHKLVDVLIQKRHIRFSRWIQIWEDPWYHDIYGGHSKKVEREEHRLLQRSTEVVYVSPLTLMYQKRFFSDCAEKMSAVPLPAMRLSGNTKKNHAGNYSFAYLGDYYSATRNLVPFYEAVKKSGFKCFIYGDSDIHLNRTEEIDVSGRVTLDKLQDIQDQASALVHLSNLSGGQIPGKIYHYSVTEKPILFILDGTEEEKQELLSYFSSFNRYFFCENNLKDIQNTLMQMTSDRTVNTAVKDFLPEEVVKKLIKTNMKE